MDPLKPKEIQQNQEEISEESLEEIDTLGSVENVNTIDQTPTKSETGFNTDKAKTVQPQSIQDVVVQNNVTSAVADSNQSTNNDNPTNVDVFVEEVLKMDITTTKPGKKARDELFNKAAKAQN